MTWIILGYSHGLENFQNFHMKMGLHEASQGTTWQNLPFWINLERCRTYLANCCDLDVTAPPSTCPCRCARPRFVVWGSWSFAPCPTCGSERRDLCHQLRCSQGKRQTSKFGPRSCLFLACFSESFLWEDLGVRTRAVSTALGMVTRKSRLWKPNVWTKFARCATKHRCIGCFRNSLLEIILKLLGIFLQSLLGKCQGIFLGLRHGI